MYLLTDTHNDLVISRHRTFEAANKARRQHARAIRRRYGPGSYIWCSITDAKTGERIDEEYFDLIGFANLAWDEAGKTWEDAR